MECKGRGPLCVDLFYVSGPAELVVGSGNSYSGIQDVIKLLNDTGREYMLQNGECTGRQT